MVVADSFDPDTIGGAVADVPENATAYAHRKANFSLLAMGSSARRVDRVWAGLASHVRGIYLSFESSQGPGVLTEAFPPATLARLRTLKAKYDPANLFRDNFNITQEGQ
jgi:berberine-like enzyme